MHCIFRRHVTTDEKEEIKISIEVIYSTYIFTMDTIDFGFRSNGPTAAADDQNLNLRMIKINNTSYLIQRLLD